MLISLDWLKQYTDIPWNVDELADRLTAVGAKVESIRRWEAVTDVVTGRVISAVEHGESERALVLCRVDVGGKVYETVSGAPNVAEGVVVPVALPGARLPGLPEPVRETTIAGAPSQVVLCSERELGISDAHDGVMVLPDDTPLGQNIGGVLQMDDPVLEIETYPNRPDCLSVIGIARETAAITGNDLRLPDVANYESGSDSVNDWIKVDVQAPDLCPRYVACVITDVKIGPSPLWLQTRLRSVGMRPINNVVDVTNFCLMEMGQPMHAFDYEKLQGARIVVRRAEDGETVATLDGDVHELTTDQLVICDAENPVALAGVMGGLHSEVTDETTTVLLESATFDAINVRKTSKALGIRTESSYRFERSLDPYLSRQAIERAAALIVEVAGGRIVPGRADEKQPLPEAKTIACRGNRVNRMLGTKLSPMEMKRILSGLGFQVDIGKDGSLLDVEVPSFRRDIDNEADIIEEIARVYGYDQIPATFPKGRTVQGKLSGSMLPLRRVSKALAGSGCFETITYSFISPDWLGQIGLPEDHPLRRVVQIQNPLSNEMSVMRTTLLPSLLRAAAVNVRRQAESIRLFEIGKRYVPTEWPPKGLPSEEETLGIVMFGEAPTSTWGAPTRQADFYDMKGIVETVGDVLKVNFTFKPASHPAFHPGRTAGVWVKDEEVGVIGEIDARVAQTFDLRGRVLAAELDLEKLLQVDPDPIVYEPLPKFPAVRRDFALLVPAGTAAVEVEKVIGNNGGDFLRSVEMFDVYEGDQIPQGFRSIAFEMTYRADDRTLTDEEVQRAQDRIEKALADTLAVKVRD